MTLLNKFILYLMPKFILGWIVEYKLNRLTNAQIQEFNRWYRESDIKKNVDKRKALK